MIAIVDYGVGNLRSIENAIRYYGDVQVDLVNDADKLLKYDKVILPGVGAFGLAMEAIDKGGFAEAITEVVKSGKFVLGICLGMQLFSSKSFEHGEHSGLNLIEGEVLPFSEKIRDLNIPHIGWNEVQFQSGSSILEGLKSNSDFYFLHSYYFKCVNPEHEIGVTEYGLPFSSVVMKDNVIGAQFHPEKSQDVGIRFLKNFIDL